MKKCISSWVILALALVVVTATGCKKSSGNNSDRPALLTKAPWKLVSLLNNGVEIIEDCDKDDVETYTSAGVYTFNKGADDCGGAEDNKTADWKFIDNNTKIVYGSTDTAVIVILDDNTLKYYSPDDPTYFSVYNH